MSLTKEELNETANKFLELKQKAKSGKEKDIKKFKEYQNICFTKFDYLVRMKANRYKKFSNYEDLVQDGFEALMSSLETYDPSKNNFAWWSSKYIGTKISRSANNHSTIRIPIKKAKEMQPTKVSDEFLYCEDNNPSQEIERLQNISIIKSAVSLLSEKQRKAILMYYEFGNSKGTSVVEISKDLKVSRPTCMKILREAKEIVKNNISDYVF